MKGTVCRILGHRFTRPLRLSNGEKLHHGEIRVCRICRRWEIRPAEFDYPSYGYEATVLQDEGYYRRTAGLPRMPRDVTLLKWEEGKP